MSIAWQHGQHDQYIGPSQILRTIAASGKQSLMEVVGWLSSRIRGVGLCKPQSSRTSFCQQEVHRQRTLQGHPSLPLLGRQALEHQYARSCSQERIQPGTWRKDDCLNCSRGRCTRNISCHGSVVTVDRRGRESAEAVQSFSFG